MKKLLIISGDRSLAGGKHGAFYNTLEGLSRHFDRIDVITPGVRQAGPDVYFQNTFIHASPWPLWLQPIWIYKMGKEIFARERFDIVTVHDYAPFYNGLGAFLLWRAIRVPYVTEIHHIPGYPKVASFKEVLYRVYSRLFIALDVAQAAAVRVVNKQQVGRFLRRSGVPGPKIRYIPSMYIDLELFHPADVPKKYDLIYVARLEKNKNVAGLIQAVEILKKRKPDVSLVIVGSGSLERELKALTRELGLEQNVSFAGWLSNAEEVQALNESRVFVNPSFNEGGPRVAVEAMACGVPVVTTKVGLMPDIIEEGKNGFFCDWNSERMAKTLGTVLENPDLRRVGENARMTAGRFSRDEAIKGYADALKVAHQKRLLVITQKVDEHDQLLGFFVHWLERLGKDLLCSVLCLEKGSYSLPGIDVTSLGKEKKNSRLARLWNFYSYIFRNHDGYDAVFVHMNPIWAVLGGWYWRLRGKKVVLWYTHKSVTLKLRVGSWFATAILTASPESFRLDSSKVIVTGHGIDTDMFKPSDTKEAHEKLKILTVGRIAPVKNYEVLVEAAKLLRDHAVNFHVTIAGEAALKKDKEYEAKLKKHIAEEGLDSHITFVGRIEHADLPALYGRHDLFVHMSNTGSLDKTLLEAMACGVRVLSSNDAAKSFLPQRLIFDGNDPADLAEKIRIEGRSPEGHEFREYVVRNHDLNGLIRKITSIVSR